MKNTSDRLLKELFYKAFIPIADELFGFEKIIKAEELTEKLQHTLEREPDFVRRVETVSGARFVLHIEFQSSNDRKMLQRMQQYHALLQMRYQLPVKQFVLYVGNKPMKMQHKQPPDETFTGYKLKDIREFAVDNFLKAETAEQVLITVLANFEREDAHQIVAATLKRLKELSSSSAMFEKYIIQLTLI